MHDFESRARRRRLLKLLGTGGGLASAVTVIPQRWSRPVVDSVMLPVHAQSSGVYYDMSDGLVWAPQRPGLFERLAGMFPTAHAGEFTDFALDTPIHICVKPNSGDFILDVLLENIFDTGSQLLSNSLQTNSVFTWLDFKLAGADCPVKAVPVEARLDSVNSKAFGALRCFEDITVNFELPMQPCDFPSLGYCVRGGP